MSENKSNHILSTSSNLLGFCLVVLTSLKVSRFNETTLIDEFTGVASIVLMGSCLLSFLAMRTKNAALGNRYERIADIVFLAGLLLIFLIIFLIAFTIAF